MKKTTFVAAGLLAITACTSEPEFQVNGNISGAEGKMLYIEASTLEGIAPLDSVKLKSDGRYSFGEPRPKSPEFYRLRIEDKVINFSIDSTETVRIDAPYNRFATEYTVEGSDNSQRIKELTMKQIKLQADADRLSNDFRANKLSHKALEDSLETLIEAYKNDVKTNYIYAAPYTASSYFALFWADKLRTINGYGDTQVDIGYVDSLVEDSVGGSMQLMTVAAVIISAVMACLLFSSFSVIVRGRVNELIKIKAAGATPAQSAFILIVEAAFYAVVGGLIGLGIGEGLIQYLNTLLDELITGATLAAPAYKYFTALAVGILCGIAACALPSVRMSSKPIHALIGGDERMTRKPPLLVAVFFTLTALALGVAQFFVEDMILNVIGVLLIAVAFVWIVTSAPHFLRFAALGARGLSRHGPAYVAMCAAPRNASVNSSLTMLAALIAFITLGTGIIDVVGLTAVPSSVRYDCDYIISLPAPNNGTTEEFAFSMLEKVRAVEGIERANIRTYQSGYSAFATGDEQATEFETAQPFVMIGMDEAQTLRYMCPNLDEEAIRLFAETEHPIILTRTIAGRYGIGIGDTVHLYTGGSDPTALASTFTVVGIDETITSFDDFFFVTIDDMIATAGWNQGAAETLILADGDPSALAPLTELMDSDPVRVYTRDGYFSAEGKDKLDTSRLIGMFTFIIYGIAGLGLVNLIVLTAGSRMKEFDVLRLAGLTPHGACDYIFTETAMLSAIGFALGLLSAFFVNRASAAIVQLIGKYITTEAFPVRMIIIAAVLTGIFALLWALSHVIAFVRTTSRRYRSRDDRLLRSD